MGELQRASLPTGSIPTHVVQTVDTPRLATEDWINAFSVAYRVPGDCHDGQFSTLARLERSCSVLLVTNNVSLASWTAKPSGQAFLAR